MLPDQASDSEGWSSQDKFNAVLESAALSEVELAEYCRRRGLYPEQLRRWRTSCEQANAQSQSAARQEADALKAERRRTRDLERELRRKNAALAETAALLTLRKKARAIWGGRGRMTNAQDRRQAVALVTEACQAGARLRSACMH